jgi:antirestriction protein ArdC
MERGMKKKQDRTNKQEEREWKCCFLKEFTVFGGV